MGTKKIIGFIGLGSLGHAIALNLAEKARLDYVYNRTHDKTIPYKEKGIAAASSVKELAGACDIVFTIVSDDQALSSFTEGPDGLAAHLKKGGIHISMSTILPATASSLHRLHRQHGSYYIAGPVLGRPEAARARKLNFCLAGDPAAKQQIQDLLTDAGAAKVWDYGEDPQSANTAKLCSNFMLVAALESMAEGLALAEESKVDKGTVMSMLSQTIFNCPIYTNYGTAIVEEKYLPAGFSLRMGQKDVRLVKEQADKVGLPMPFADVLRQRLENCIKAGLGDHDLAAIALDVTRQTAPVHGHSLSASPRKKSGL